ncbi:flagellar hook-associated protein FlgL [Desulfotomaculum sp. 1211_IL3151]|uniref:flagellar hook-associated protein FlgL n=1 Tax=Desulfotomaculum sp. 1211_IL3151 TaxID=3084055 RepID=UPI002FD94181
MLRISTSLLGNNLRNYIQNNLQRAAKYQEQAATGKTINRPSDDPAQISYLMSVNGTLTRNEQYSRNIEDGLAYLNQSDSALNTLGKALQDAKILALDAANGTKSQQDREAIALQIDKQIDALVDLANSSLGGKYLFSGRKNAQPPFYRDPASGEVYYRGDTNLVSREIIFGYSYEVVAAGVADNYITSTVDLSQGVLLTDKDLKFRVALDENNVQEIDLGSCTPPLHPGLNKFEDIKKAMQQALDTAFGAGTIAVDDDAKGHIILKANNDAADFKVLASAGSTGHTTLFGGERTVVDGVFGKLASPSNPSNQISDPLNPGHPMTRVLGGPFKVLGDLVAALRNGEVQDSAAGVPCSYLTGSADMSGGKTFNTDDELKFEVALDGSPVKIDLKGYLPTGTLPVTMSFDDIKSVMQQALTDKFGSSISVDDDGKGNILLIANGNVTNFTVSADGTNTGYNVLFGGVSGGVHKGIPGKLPNPSAAGVAYNYITGSKYHPDNKVEFKTADDLIFDVVLNDPPKEVRKTIDLTDDLFAGSFSPGFKTMEEVKVALRKAVNDALQPDNLAITVDDDGEGHLRLTANNNVTNFKVLASGTPPGNGHNALFGGERTGVFEKSSGTSNPMQQLDDAIKNLEIAHDDVLKHRVGVGARTRHLQSVQDQLDDQEIKLKGILVELQGVDIAKLTVEIAQNQLVHNASLMTATDLLKTSLLNYLK